MKKLILFFVITGSLNLFAQNYFFNKALKQCLLRLAKQTNSDYLIIKKEVNKSIPYYKMPAFLKSVRSNDKKKIYWHGLLTNYEKGEINLCKKCFIDLKDKGLKISIIKDSFDSFEEKFNSEYCLNPNLTVKKGDTVLEIEFIRPVEIERGVFLIILHVNRTHLFRQNNNIVGINLLKSSKNNFYFVCVSQSRNILSSKIIE
ncbi:hypothetical protein TTHT_1998 [Thermotomaculum hydrothermale]|uniref:Uncharacterized protein n=1 Tax=Thermotomaculum hydrothermale TaxID=981385 RepID=A0A7R6PQF4_9BACT|nr:hypothetical protein [Thermotomaculum hydrothermale]BBB33441.1 hypothetical protein TTHT_1998 [Thermotomaculum hydrothermale]